MKGALTRARLKELLHYDRATGVFTWRVRRNQNVNAGDRAGRVGAKGYRVINISHDLYTEHRLAVFYMTGRWPLADVDHRNGQRDDNRWKNLRKLSRTGNMQNLQGAHRDNKSGFLGVARHGDRFRAYIRADGKNRYLGSFGTLELAHAAYLEAKRALHPAGTL